MAGFLKFEGSKQDVAAEQIKRLNAIYSKSHTGLGLNRVF